MDLSIIIPVYDSEITLERLINRIIEFFNGSLQFEIILVFDQGTSGSWEEIKRLTRQYPSTIKGIRLNKNYGQHWALLCGFQYSSGGLVATLDEDMQYNPEELLKLIQKHNDTQADVVYGMPVKYKQPVFRRLSSYIVHILLNLTIKGLNRKFSSLRLIIGELARFISQKAYRYVFLDGILAAESNKIVRTSVEHKKRVEGKSTWSVRKLTDHISKVLIYYSEIPVYCLISGIILIVIATCIYITEALRSFWILIILLEGVIFLFTGIIFLILKNIKSPSDVDTCVSEII